MSRKSTRLKIALFQCGRTQYEIAADADISETRLSRLACGRTVPTAEERVALSRVLGVPEAALFEAQPAKGGRVAA